MADALGLGEPRPSDLKLSSGHGGNAGGNGGDNPHPKKSMVKKRTKTGCLSELIPGLLCCSALRPEYMDWI